MSINVVVLNLLEVDVQLYSLPSTQRAKAELPFQLLIGSFDEQSHRHNHQPPRRALAASLRRPKQCGKICW